MQKLKVKADGLSLVPDFEAMRDGVLRFIGRRHDPAAGVAGGWPSTEEAVEVPFCREYLEELRARCLAPADAETARAAGVPFTAS